MQLKHPQLEAHVSNHNNIDERQVGSAQQLVLDVPFVILLLFLLLLLLLLMYERTHDTL